MPSTASGSDRRTSCVRRARLPRGLHPEPRAQQDRLLAAPCGPRRDVTPPARRQRPGARSTVEVHNDCPPYVRTGPDPRSGLLHPLGQISVGCVLPDGAERRPAARSTETRSPSPSATTSAGPSSRHTIEFAPQARHDLRLEYDVPAAARRRGRRPCTYRLDLDPQGMVSPQSVERDACSFPTGFTVDELPEGWTRLTGGPRPGPTALETPESRPRDRPTPPPRLPAMDRLLVTGGAGFIGSNFVHHLIAQHRRARHRARQDDLRRQQGVPRRAARGPGAAGRRRHRRRRRGRPAGRRARRGRALRSRVAQRQLAQRPEPVHPHQHPRHVHDPRGRPEAREAPPPRLDRRGLRRPRARRPQALHRGHALQPLLALLRLQGRLRPPRPRLGPQLRRAGDGVQLLQQLRPVAAHREVHPAPDHQRHRRHPPQALRLGRERPRLDPRRRPLLGRAGRS